MHIQLFVVSLHHNDGVYIYLYLPQVQVEVCTFIPEIVNDPEESATISKSYRLN